MAFSFKTVQEFEKITKFDLNGFILLYEYFNNRHLTHFTNYLMGTEPKMNQDSLYLHLLLSNMYDKLNVACDQFSDSFSSTDFWTLISLIDEIGQALKSVPVMGKFLKVTQVRSFNESRVFLEHIKAANQDLEDIAIRFFNSEENWHQIAITNSLSDSNYTFGAAGPQLTIPVKKGNSATLDVDSVVDSLNGERILGLDLDRNYQFVNDDLKTLNYKDTFYQACDILMNLRQGDLPEIREAGIDVEYTVGGNIADFSIPFLIDQIKETFGIDDSIQTCEITDLERKGSSINVEVEITSLYGNTYKNIVEI